MSQAITNKTLIRTAKYGWLVCDYTISGKSLSYSLYFHWDGGDCQLDNCYIKFKNGSDIWRNSGRVYNYQRLDSRGKYEYPIHSGTATISGEKTIQFGITKYQNVGLSGEFTVTGGSAPANFSASNIVAKWDRITFTSTIGSPNGTLTSHAPCVSIVPLAGGVQKYENAASGTIPTTITTTITNSSTPINSPAWTIKGCGMYYVGAYAANSAGTLYGQGPAVYTPPSPPVLTHTEPSDSANGDVHIKFVGGTHKDNWSSYDTPELTRTVRYNVNGGSWIYIVNDVNALMTDITEATVPVLAGDTVVVEAWMSYHGFSSEVKTVTLTNTPNAALYGSVNNLSKSLHPVYATFGNYFDGRHYVPRSGAGVDISGDQITITRTSGSGAWTYVFFLIDSTDELINKEVTLSGEFSTSGSFTSGPRLFWMKSNNVDWLSLVDGMEYQATGTNKEFSITGTIPARPSGAGKLGLGLYANWSTSVSQGSYTVYNNVELKANVKNISNPTSVSASVTTNGITATYDATTQTFTFNGTCNKDNTCFTCSKLLNLEAGKYSLSFFVKGGSLSNITGATKIQYQNSNGWANTILVPLGNTSASNSTTIPARPSNTNNVRFDNGVVANNYQIQIQLERGDATGSFAPFVDTKTHKLKKIYGSVDGRSKLIYCEGYN